jgi:hypothetical protein
MCKEGLKRLTPKVDKWINKNPLNIIVKINKFQCKIKNIHYFWESGGVIWGKYRDCDTYKGKLSEYLVNEYPNQIGMDVYKKFNKILTSN